MVSSSSARFDASWNQDNQLSKSALLARDAVDWGLMAAILTVPLIMGGRLAIGQIALAIAASWSAIAWAIHSKLNRYATWQSTHAEWLLFGGVLVAVVQFIPLPSSILSLLSPHQSEIIPLWQGSEGALGTWSTISLNPAATQLGLATFGSYALIFCVVSQRVRCIQDVEKMLKWIALSVSFVAAFGIVQYLTSNGKFFWFFDYPYTSTEHRVKGSFSNKNHFAQFMALGVGPLVWWCLSVLRQEKTQPKNSFSGSNGRQEVTLWILLAALGTVTVANLLSLSRGGTIAMSIGGIAMMLVLYKKDYVSGKLIVMLAGVGLLASCFLFMIGFEKVADRLDNWESAARWKIWAANLEVAKDFPILGTGIGTHADVYQMYLDHPFVNREFTHAENGYLQTLSEMGGVGFGLCIIGLGLLFSWCIRGLRRSDDHRLSIALTAILGSFVANAFHSLVDFVWYVPGCMVMIAVMGACACRLFQFSSTDGSKAEPVLAQSTGSGFALPQFVIYGGAAVWMISTLVPAATAEQHWLSYLRLTFAAPAESRGSDDEHVETDTFAAEQTLEQQQASQENILKQKLIALSSASKANPSHSRPHVRLAMGYMTIFNAMQTRSEMPMSLWQIRDAAWMSQFESEEALNDWFDRALGENKRYLDAAWKHAKRAVELNPLEGHAYLYLSELSFMHGGTRETQDEYVTQALTVKPFTPQVLFVAGRNEWMTVTSQAMVLETLDPRIPQQMQQIQQIQAEIKTSYNQAIDYWKQAFHQDVEYQSRIIELLAGSVTAQFMIDSFQPDWDALARLKQRYGLIRQTRPSDYATVLKAYAMSTVKKAQKRNNPKPVNDWISAARAFAELGDVQSTKAAFQAGLKTDRHDYKLRFAFGKWLYQSQQFAESHEHLDWCLLRKPNDRVLQQMAEHAAAEVGNSSIRPASNERSPVRTAFPGIRDRN